MVYGRLAQWSNSKGHVHRSYSQLGIELGMTQAPVKRYISELKETGLIGTYRKKQGGVNNFEFYDHEWMHEEMNSLLDKNEIIRRETIHEDYLENNDTPGLNRPYPGSKQTLPPGLNRPYPGSKQTLLKYKEVIINNNNNNKLGTSQNEIKKNTKELFGIKDILKDNPFEINEDLIKDWMKVRSKKRAAITKTAWVNICNELHKCRQKNLNPVECFEIAVASGWQSLKVEYFLKTQHKNNSGSIDNSSTDWAKDVFKPFHEMGVN
jgi:hypothetical protein